MTLSRLNLVSVRQSFAHLLFVCSCWYCNIQLSGSYYKKTCDYSNTPTKSPCEFHNIAVFRISFLFVNVVLKLRKEILILKCPVCSGKLDFNLKVRSATCHTCGWNKTFSINPVRSKIVKGGNFISAKKS
jgi:hypothetical protein